MILSPNNNNNNNNNSSNSSNYFRVALCPFSKTR